MTVRYPTVRAAGLGFAFAVTAALAVRGAFPLAHAAAAGAALSGRVTSPLGQPMEGVVVGATRAGSTITIDVVSNAAGEYDFPASRVGAGRYHLEIRAIGYALAGPADVTVRRGRTTTENLSLRSVKDIDDQMTNSDWLISMPGNPMQKDLLLNCTTCHTIERIVTSHFTAQDFKGVMQVMAGFANQASDLEPQRKLKLPASIAAHWGGGKATLRKFMASINEGKTGKLAYALKTLPRPRGRGTEVIYTVYALPRPSIQPHDVVVDHAGRVWFSEFGDDDLGQLDPRTGQVIEYPIPTMRPKEPHGSLDLEFDQQGNLWIARMNQGGIAEFNYVTHKFKTYEVPKPYISVTTQQPMVAPEHWEVDGEIWMNAESLPGLYGVNVRTGKWRRFLPYGLMKGGGGGEYAFGRPHSVYGVYSDSRNDAFFCDFSGENIGEIDARTGKITLFPTPTPHSRPRRGDMDAHDRLWFAEWRGNKFAEFDTRSHQFKEWPIPVPYFAPYQVVRDKHGDLWAGGMSSDRIARLNPTTGKITVYLLPGSTNIRHMFVDDSGPRPVLWIGSNHGGNIIRMEPLD
jgi:virginiamycin B lyase